MSLSVMQRSAAEVGIGHFVPKKQEASVYADARAELEKNPLLFQILANFEQEHGLPTFIEGAPEEILDARICRYVLVSLGWGLRIAPDELTHAGTWTALAAA
ncbi:MAG: hypothetical protein ACFNLE_05970 [Rothia aeria]